MFWNFMRFLGELILVIYITIAAIVIFAEIFAESIEKLGQNIPTRVRRNFILILAILGVVLSFVAKRPFLQIDNRLLLKDSSNSVNANQPLKKIEKLQSESQRIQNTLSDIENLTINEIQTELKNTLFFVEKLRAEAIQQEKLISDLRDTAEKEKTKVNESKQIADSVLSLSEGQIEAVKLLITDSSRKNSEKSFWMGVIISLPIGVIASMAGSFLIKKRKN